jgi:hypothetical protein
LEYLNGEALLAEMQVRRRALQQNPRADVCYGSKADMTGRICDVRFTPPESGHFMSTRPSPISDSARAETYFLFLVALWLPAVQSVQHE